VSNVSDGRVTMALARGAYRFCAHAVDRANRTIQVAGDKGYECS